jgi:hypothetical protein
MHSRQKLGFERYRNDFKKRYEDDKKMIGIYEHQILDHPSTFMRMSKGRSNVMSAANNVRREILNPLVIS